MLNHEITSVVGKHKRRRRVGRGIGSGHGKTCGRGHKGSLSRSGASPGSFYEGGRIPLFRKLPKRGFSNYKFANHYEIINVSQLEKFNEGETIGIKQLADAGLLENPKSKVKILGNGDLTKSLKVIAHKFSKTAKQKIEASGGTAEIISRQTKKAKR